MPRLAPLPRAGLRSVDELRHLAQERKSHAVFSLLWQGDVPLQTVASEPLVLAQTVRGAINHFAAVEAHPDEVARLIALGEEALGQLAVTSPGTSSGEPFFRASADWADFLLARAAFSRSRSASARALARGPERFPALRFELTFAHAAAQLALGEVAPAANALEDLARRPWLYPQRDAGAMARLTQLRARAALLLGQPERHRALCWDVLSLPGLDDDRRLGSLKALARSAGGWWRSFDPGVAAPGLSARAQYAAWLGHLGLARVKAWRSLGLARLSATVAHAASNGLTRVRGALERRDQARKRQGQRGVLVTRAMGGLGDLLMMTPGLHALARRHRNERVTFAIPLGFHSLFAGDPAFDLVDIEDRSLTPDGFRAWHDLTDCPASRVESRTAPNVTRSRIELFAEGMGISPHELDRAGRRPRCCSRGRSTAGCGHGTTRAASGWTPAPSWAASPAGAMATTSATSPNPLPAPAWSRSRPNRSWSGCSGFSNVRKLYKGARR